MKRSDYKLLSQLEEIYPQWCPFVDLSWGLKPSFWMRRVLARLEKQGYIEKEGGSWRITTKGEKALRIERCCERELEK